MIEEKAQIIAIDNDIVTVECITKSACGRCASQKSCSTGIVSSAFNARSQKVLLENSQGISLNVSDSIIIGIPERSLLQGAFLVYIFPLLFFVISAIISAEIFKASEGITICIAFFSSGIAYLISRKLLGHKTASFSPVILRKN